MKALAADAALVHPSVFITIAPDDTITLVMKHIECGQGIHTDLTTLIADEMDADLTKIDVVAAPTNPICGNPLQGGMQVTGASDSMANSFETMCRAGATARAMLVSAVAEAWGVDAGEIAVRDGVLSHAASGWRGTFGEFSERAAALAVPSDVPLKTPDRRRQIGGVRTNLPALSLVPHGLSGSPSDAGGITPSLEGAVTGSSVVVGGQALARDTIVRGRL